MGSSHRGDFGKFAGGSTRKSARAVGSAIDEVQDALSKNKPAKIAIGTAVDVLAASNPAIGTLVGTYKASKIAYKAATAAKTTYDKTHDPHEAAKAAAKEGFRAAVGVTRNQIISNAVDLGWHAAKSSAGISSNGMQDKILTSALKNTLDEVLPK